MTMLGLFSKARPIAAPDPAVGSDPVDSARDRLRSCATVDDIIAVLRSCGRAIVGADGVTIVRRERDEVVYVTEDAISPLWSGRRFPIRTCVSGMAILARAPIVIPDIMEDKRVPLNAYLATFVRSMAMVPVGHDDPRLALGAYWRDAGPAHPSAVERLTMLAAAAADAIERIEGSSSSDRQVA